MTLIFWIFERPLKGLYIAGGSSWNSSTCVFFKDGRADLRRATCGFILFEAILFRVYIAGGSSCNSSPFVFSEMKARLWWEPHTAHESCVMHIIVSSEMGGRLWGAAMHCYDESHMMTFSNIQTEIAHIWHHDVLTICAQVYNRVFAIQLI